MTKKTTHAKGKKGFQRRQERKAMIALKSAFMLDAIHVLVGKTSEPNRDGNAPRRA